MKKKYVNFGKFFLASAFLSGICLASLESNFLESNLERMLDEKVPEASKEPKDTVKYSVKMEDFYFDYSFPQ